MSVLVLLLHRDQLVVEAQIHVVTEFPAHKGLKNKRPNIMEARVTCKQCNYVVR